MPLVAKKRVESNPATWTHPNLELGWLKGGPSQNNWADAYGLIWNKEPVYCAASVHVTDKEYYIGTSGWHGMKAEDKKSLEVYLKSFLLTPLLPETVP